MIVLECTCVSVFLRPHAAVMRDSNSREMCKCGEMQLTAITLKRPTDICSSYKLMTEYLKYNSQHHSGQMKIKNTQTQIKTGHHIIETPSDHRHNKNISCVPIQRLHLSKAEVTAARRRLF